MSRIKEIATYTFKCSGGAINTYLDLIVVAELEEIHGSVRSRIDNLDRHHGRGYNEAVRVMSAQVPNVHESLRYRTVVVETNETFCECHKLRQDMSGNRLMHWYNIYTL
jgi:hypothetical protein